MSEERFNNIEESIKDLTEKVSHLDKSFAEVTVTLKDYAGWTKQLEQTIRNLDNTVHEMNLKNQNVPYERVQDIKNSIDPIYTILRQHREEFISKRDSQILVSVAVFFIGGIIILLGVFGSYVMKDVKEDILHSGKVNRDSIEANTNAILEHNKTRDEVIKLMHDHKGTGK